VNREFAQMRAKRSRIFCSICKKKPNAAFVYKSIKAIPGLPFHEEQTRRLAEIFNQLARAI
jgi:hypothetical protein